MNAEPFNGGFPDIASAWMLLQRQILLKPIRSEADYQRMLRLASQLTAQINGNADSPLADLVGVVKDLIQVWETHRVTLPKAAPREVLRELLRTHGLKQKDLADIASPTVISDILAGRRAISKNVAKALAERFHTDVGIFI